MGLGFSVEAKHEVETKGLRFGANSHLKVDHENVFELRGLYVLKTNGTKRNVI